MNWKSVADYEVVRKTEVTMHEVLIQLDKLERNIRELKKTTLLDKQSLLWLEWLDSCRSQLQLTIKNKDK